MKLSNQDYTQKYIAPLFEPLMVELLQTKPADSAVFMINWLNQKGIKIIEDTNQENSDDDADDDVLDDKEMEKIQMDKQNSRSGVSAQVYGDYNQKGNFKPKIITKNEDQIKRIRAKLENVFMFQSLEQNDKKIVIDAMEEKKFNPADVIITQGEDGNCMFIVDQGELDCFRVMKKGEEPQLLKVYKAGQAFGELALLYNAPRAATIKAKVQSVLFQLDRETFNFVVKDAASKKREKYQNFLSKVQLLSEIQPYERLQIADALRTKDYKQGELLIKQGDGGDIFFLLETGHCEALKIMENDKPPIKVMDYQSGDYFGELALLQNAPRAASVMASTDVTVVTLTKQSFDRLLGPLNEILQRNSNKYGQQLVI